jgi:hypothetical protein
VQAMLGQFKVDKSFVLGQISDDYGFSNYKLYTTLRANLSLLNAELYQLELMVMISFIFFRVSWLLNKGFYEYYFEVFDNDARNGFKSSKTPVFSNRIVTDEEKKDELLQQQNDNINSLENSLKKKTSNYRRLISYKRQERERAV